MVGYNGIAARELLTPRQPGLALVQVRVPPVSKRIGSEVALGVGDDRRNFEFNQTANQADLLNELAGDREMDVDHREQACSRFLEPTNAAYIGKINDHGDIRSALFDDEGEALAIGSEKTLRQVAMTNGFVIVSRH